MSRYTLDHPALLAAFERLQGQETAPGHWALGGTSLPLGDELVGRFPLGGRFVDEAGSAAISQTVPEPRGSGICGWVINGGGDFTATVAEARRGWEKLLCLRSGRNRFELGGGTHANSLQARRVDLCRRDHRFPGGLAGVLCRLAAPSIDNLKRQGAEIIHASTNIRRLTGSIPSRSKVRRSRTAAGTEASSTRCLATSSRILVIGDYADDGFVLGWDSDKGQWWVDT